MVTSPRAEPGWGCGARCAASGRGGVEGWGWLGRAVARRRPGEGVMRARAADGNLFTGPSP